MPNNGFTPSGVPTPPASPPPFNHGKFNQPQQFFAQQQQQHHHHHQHHHPQQQPTPATTPNHSRLHPQQPYVPVAPQDRIGTFLGSSLLLQRIIGTGAYGVVYEAVDTKTNVRYAVKALNKGNKDGTPLDARQVEYQTREIRLHYTASAHPNVVSLLKIIDAYPDCLFVVLEYCPEGDLFFNITERGLIVGRDDLTRKSFLQILDAVHFLHQSGIYHRDLKPENILVTDNGENLKLADFGLAIASDRSEDYGCGSTFYMSPECLGQTSSKRPFYYCAPNDVWSLGVILVNLACGRNPWKQASAEDSTYLSYMRHPGFLKTILPITDELDDILARIFTPNPDQRITLPELRQRIVECPRFSKIQQPQQQQQQVQNQVHVQAQEAPVVVPQQPVIVCSSPVVSSSAATSSECAVYDYDDEEEEEVEVEEDLFEDEKSSFVSLASDSPASSSGTESDCETESSSSDMSGSPDDCLSLVDDDEEMEADFASQCQDMPLTPPPPMLAAHPPPPPTVAEMLYNYEHEDPSTMMAMDISLPAPYQLQQQLQQQQLQHQQLQHEHQQQFQHQQQMHQQHQPFMFHAPAVYHQPMPEYQQMPQHQQHVLPSHMPMQQQKPLPSMCVPQPTSASNHPMGSKFWDWFGKPLQMHFHQQIHQMHPFQNQVFLSNY